MSTRTQDARSGQSAEQRRRRRKDRSTKSRTPEPKNIVSGAGQPLDPGVRRDLEEQLGHDLSRVRLHTDRDAAHLTDLLGADAVAVGQDVLFGAGAFKPGTDEGRRLLAHELLHTIQNPHGLGALRAGRELGAVSLPQQAIEREAESAAQDLVRDPGSRPETADVEQGQATPGWLRYATVDADRRRTEQLDPATLVDRAAGGLLRSLRGDPEDRSGRVRRQLARMAPEVQETVLDRLELRLPSPALDRLLDLVAEAEETGPPLSVDATAAPVAVPDAAEEIEEERERAADEERQDEREREDGAREDSARPQSARRQDDDGGPTKGDGSRAPEDRKNENRDTEDRGDEKAPGWDDAPGGQDGARDGEEAGARQQERSRTQQEDRQASGQDARQDEADERKDAAHSQKEQQEQDRREEKNAQEEAEVPQDEAAQEPEEQAGEHGPRQAGAAGEAEVARRPAAAAATVDRSGAEPGEKARTGADIGAARTLGDPENEEDADDEPLGLEAESVEDDAEPEPDSEGESGDGRPPADTAPSGEDTADDPRLFQRRKRGAPRAPALTSSDGPSAVEEAQETQDTAEPGTAPDARARTDEDDAEDRAVQELMGVVSAGQDTVSEGDGPASALAAHGAAVTGTFTSVAEKDRGQEPQEDAEAARGDAQALAADGAGSDAVAPRHGEEGGPEHLAKADEDARTQSASSPSGSKHTSYGSDSAEGTGRTAAATNSSDQSGAQAGTGADKGTAQQAGKDTDRTGTATGRGGSDTQQGEGDADSAPTTPGPDGGDGTGGTGPATSPGAVSGPDRVSAPGPARAPGLAPGNGPVALSAGPEQRTNTPQATKASGTSGAAPNSRARPTGGKRQAARQAAKTVRRSSGGSGRTASASAPVRSAGHSAGRSAPAGGSKPKREAPAPDVSRATPEDGLATAAGLKPHVALKTLKGVDGAVGRSVDKERTALRSAPPATQRPSGSPRTVPGGPKASAPGTYTNAKVVRTEAARGRTPEITGEQRPEGEVPGANMPEPSWWDIAVTIGAQLLGKLLKEILPLDDLIDSILQIPTKDDGLRNARVGDAPGLPLQDDSDPQRTDEQSGKLDERKTELHRSGREDAARNMGEDQIYPDVPGETLTGKVPGGKGGVKAGGPQSVSGGVPIESASAVAEHDRGPQIQAGFTEGRQRMGQERQAKDKKATDDRKQHDEDLRREVDTSSKKQADTRNEGRSDIADSRDEWRKEQDDKAAEIDGKKGKKYEKVRKDIDDKEEQTDKDVDKRTEDDNKQIETEQNNAEQEAEKKQQDGKEDADNWLEEAIEQLKKFFEELKKAIKTVFELARKAVTDLIDKFKQEVFKLIDDARNWVVDLIDQFADDLIALGDELLADYPAMRDKWRNTIKGARDWAVQKVDEAADALKDVAGKLLDGLCDALLAGLDVLESGLLAAVDVAESVTVGALEFGAAAIAALGEWAAIVNDIVADPGDWISKAWAAAETGAKEHLFNEIKTAVKAWFDQKVQEIIGISPEDFQALLDGGVTVAEMAQMAWDEAVPQLPLIIGTAVVEKVVAKLIPGAGWVMAVIDALQTAWGALSAILAAFGLFMDFLKSVKSGNGALPFARAVAAGVVALLELVYQFLIEGISRFMGKVADRLGDMLKNILGRKNRPGGQDPPDKPGGPGNPKDDRPKGEEPKADKPKSADETVPTSDRPAARPTPRKPSPDRTSRPPSKPRPGKRSSPEKKPRPSHTTRPKKRRDDDERREEGREVNAARKRARDAERSTRDEDRDARADGPTRRGPARDTARPGRRRPGTDDHDRDPKSTHPDDKRHTDDRRRDPHRDKGSTDKDRGPGERPGRVRRARQTIKSAVNRARRAARKLFGKARRKFGSRLNDRLRRLRDLLRRRRDRMRDDRSRRPDRDRRDRDRRDEGTEAVNLPKVRFADADDGERHTLMFHGRGPRAPLYIHSTPQEVPPFIEDWREDLERPEAEEDRAKQLEYLKAAEERYNEARKIQQRIPAETDEGKRKQEIRRNKADLERKMKEFANQARIRLYFDLPKPDFQPFVNLSLGEKQRRPDEKHVSKYIGTSSKTVFGGGGEEARGQPPGWSDVTDRGLSIGARWVRMHLLPERIGGKATGNNLVPARGPETNIDFLNNIEQEAYDAISGTQTLIWYESGAEFNHPDWPHLPSHIYAQYDVYEKIDGTGKEHDDWSPNGKTKRWEQGPDPIAENEKTRLSINSVGSTTIQARLLEGRHRRLAEHFVQARRELHLAGGRFTEQGRGKQLRKVMKDFAEGTKISLAGLDLMWVKYEDLIEHGQVSWT